MQKLKKFIINVGLCIVNPFHLAREHRQMEELREANPSQNVYLTSDHQNYRPR